MGRTAWEAAFNRYSLAVMMRESAKAFGPIYKAEEDHLRNTYAIKRKFGVEKKAALKGSDAWAAYNAEDSRQQDEMDALYERYYDPVREIAQEIVKIPAQNLIELRFKVKLIENEELYCYAGTEDAFDYVEADAKRIAA